MIKQTLQWSLCHHSSVHTNLMGLCASAVVWLTGRLHAMDDLGPIWFFTYVVQQAGQIIGILSLRVLSWFHRLLRDNIVWRALTRVGNTAGNIATIAILTVISIRSLGCCRCLSGDLLIQLQAEEIMISWILKNIKTSSMETFSALLALCAGNSPVSGEFPAQKPVTQSVGCIPWSAPWINSWVNNRQAGDLRRHRAHYDVIVMDDGVVTWNNSRITSPLGETHRWLMNFLPN